MTAGSAPPAGLKWVHVREMRAGLVRFSLEMDVELPLANALELMALVTNARGATNPPPGEMRDVTPDPPTPEEG